MIFRKNITILLLLGICLFSLRVKLTAQSDLSTVRGTVHDPSGAVLAGTSIELVSTETNLPRSIMTNDNGDFEIPNVSRGTYRLSAKKPGFKTYVANDIILESNQTRRIDVRLELGDVSAEVTVSASAAVIDTDTPKIQSGFTKDRYQVNPFPSSFAIPNYVLTTLPNVQTPMGGLGISFAGQPSTQISEGLDGVTSDGSVSQLIHMGDVQEVQAVTVNNSAEFRSPGYFNMVTKSGTNQWHGNAYYNHTNSALNARGLFDAQKPRSLVHTFGIDGAGPIIKDKTFVFASWSGERIPGQSFYLRDVPSSAMRTGDFSELLGLTKVVQIKDPLTGTLFPNNIIPVSRLNATALKIQQEYMPAPNLGAADALTKNFGFLFPYPSDRYRRDYLTQKIDHRLTKDNTLSGRLMTRFTPYVLAGNYPGLNWTRHRFDTALSIEDVHVFSPTVVNTGRFSWAKDKVVDGDKQDNYQPQKGDEVVHELGLTGVNPSGLSAQGFPAMNITGYSAITVQPGGVSQNDRNLSFADSLTWAKGQHVMKFGAELKTFRNFNGTVPTGTYGNFSFNGTLTNNAYADFLLGLPYSSQRVDPLTNRVRQAKEFGTYAQDSFKANDKLSFEFGLRWDYFTTPTYEDGLLYNFDPATGNIIVPQSAQSSVSSLYPSSIPLVTGNVIASPDKKNFAPRFGVAYRPWKNTVVRGGYGLFTATLGSYSPIAAGGPYQISETFFNQITNGQALFSFPNAFPAGAGSIPSQSASGYPFDTHNGRIHQFNLSIEHQIKDIGLRVSYIGSRSRGMSYSLEIDKPQPSLTSFQQSRRPYPQFVSTTMMEYDGRNNYNALQFEAQRKVGWVTFQVHYTLASNMSDYLNLQNPYSHTFWNRDAYTPRHRAVMNLMLDLPFGHGAKYLSSAHGAVNQLVGGWQLYWVTFLQSGQYFSPSYSGFDSSNTNTTSGLPDRIADGNLPSGQRTINQWFDTAAFVVPRTGTFGNSGVNILEGPGLNVSHLTVSKNWNLTERVRLRYIAAIADIFNHHNLYFPASNISVPAQAGVISSDYGTGAEGGARRQIEMRLRLEF